MTHNDILTKALEALDAEAWSGNESYKRIHEYIEPMLYNADEETLKAIAERKKTIAGAVSAMRDKAQKQLSKGANCVVLSDDEGFAICEKYFGISAEKSKKSQSNVMSIFDL